jgi:hypothetical protein
MFVSIRNAAVAFSALFALGFAACAGNEARPTADLIRARTLIDQARQSGAYQFAAGDLQNARDKLHQAEAAADKRNNAVARRLAVEASLDAELAAAKTRSAKAEGAAEQVQASVKTLREEAARTRVQP